MSEQEITAIEVFEKLLPEHKASLDIVHNQHLGYYQSAAEYVDEDRLTWKNTEAKDRAIATNTVWELQWYPETPVGFLCVAAPTLLELIELAQEIKAR